MTKTKRSLTAGLALAGVLGLSAMATACAPASAASAAVLPSSATDVAAGPGDAVVVLSGGCFWGVQGVFQHVKGVRSAVSGYAGGGANTANYDTVSTGTTGHAESVRVTYDPKQISYGQILRIFFSVATDPTQLNHQFPDEGTQYRSEIFYTTADQQRVAQAYIAQLNAGHAFKTPIVTRVDPLKGFYKAEGYHQDYLTLHPESGYIQAYDLPKVADLKRSYPQYYSQKPVLVGGRS